MGFLTRKPPRIDHPLFERVRDALSGAQRFAESHGGRIELISIDSENRVTIRMRGACAFCPLVDLTVKRHVQEALKAEVPEISEVKVKV
ncbi:MAG: NifU family protein [Armatimonadetes bacterium]|nr:NifU family protein [Armatimonadota bacterium]